jgi:hypothetical protein
MTPPTREQFRHAMRWFGQALFVAPFALGLVGIVETRTRVMEQLPISVHLPSILVGALGSLPLFALVPLITAAIPWFDRGLPGVLILSALLSIPAVLTALAAYSGLPVAPAFIVAMGAIATPRVVAKSLPPGVFTSTHR